jgi:hypothetical protein
MLEANRRTCPAIISADLSHPISPRFHAAFIKPSPARRKLGRLMKSRHLITVLLVPALLLLLPLVAMQFTDEVAWSPGDFLAAWILMMTAGLAYLLVTARAGSLVYRAAAGVAVGAAFLLVWVNLAVGLIGNEGNPANLLYGGVLAVGLVGAALARFQPRGMARALAATALAQALVPVLALLAWQPQSTADALKIFAANTLFALLFAASALLFRQAARKTHATTSEERIA